jgi:predicted RecB family nuclease
MNKRMWKIIPPQLKKRKKNPYNHYPDIHCSKLQQMQQEKPAKNKVKLWFHQIGFLKVFPAHNSLKM